MAKPTADQLATTAKNLVHGALEDISYYEVEDELAAEFGSDHVGDAEVQAVIKHIFATLDRLAELKAA